MRTINKKGKKKLNFWDNGAAQFWHDFSNLNQAKYFASQIISNYYKTF